MALIVLYDACVLYPAPLRDLLMQLAMTGLYQAKWTERIHEEWITNLLYKRPDLSRNFLEKTKDLMNSHAGDCLIYDYEDLIPALNLPDKDDCHVLAAAIKACVSIILTYNLKDFPCTVLQHYKIKAQDPDSFIINLLDLHPEKVQQSIQLHRKRLKNPPKSVEEYLKTLEEQKLYRTVKKLIMDMECL